MSGLMHPVGPEPALVYWVRRGAIVLVVLTLVIVLGWLVRGRGSAGQPEPAGAASPAAASSAAAAPVSATPAPAGELLPCTDADLLVEATTDASTYRVGSTPRLSLSITNTSARSCTRDVGPKANSLEITSGGYHVWSSDDCNASDREKVVTLEPGEKVASSITWNGRTSQQGCPNEGTVAKAGRYEVVGRNGDLESDGTPFALTKQQA